MDAASAQHDMVEGYLQKIESEQFLNIPLMDRVEQMFTSQDQLERYIEILFKKIEGEQFVSGDTLNRIERLLRLLHAMQQQR